MVFSLSGRGYSINNLISVNGNVGGGGGATFVERIDGTPGLVASGGGGGGLQVGQGMKC